MVKVAEGACLRVGNLINATATNATAMQAIQNAGLTDAFNGNVSLFEGGEAFVRGEGMR